MLVLNVELERMKAAWYAKNGPAHEVLVVGELPDPNPGPAEVLVEIHTSGVNPSDVKSRTSRPLDGDLIVPHSDGAGIIVEVGPGVPRERIGQRVWLWNGQWKRPMGTAAEYIALPQQQATPLPDNVSFEAGACLGIPALTAVHAVRCAGELQGLTVLVTGAGSAVGHYVAQIARMRGARVIGTAASAARQDHARTAGVAEVIDYKREDVARRVQELTGDAGADVVIDLDFSSTARLLSQGLLKPHGRLVCYGSNVRGDVPIDFTAALWRSLDLRFFLVYDLLPHERQAALEELDGLLRTDALQHALGPVFELAGIVSAHQAVEAGTHVGNVVLRTRA